MGVQVTFDPAAFQAAFPEFAALSAGQVTAYYTMGLTFQKNDGTGPVNDANTQLTGLQLLTAHVATLFAQSQGDPNPGSPKDANTPVGRVSEASQGSVRVRTELPANMAAASAWFAQTKYGLMWWQMMAQYRTARFVGGRNPLGAPLPTFGGWPPASPPLPGTPPWPGGNC